MPASGCRSRAPGGSLMSGPERAGQAGRARHLWQYRCRPGPQLGACHLEPGPNHGRVTSQVPDSEDARLSQRGGPALTPAPHGIFSRAPGEESPTRKPE